mmetsp:Transcript_61284/g.197480  ORF Transcript_61284/g.197480 Transcript_61284/m.197480 type:complete len:266 (-) Transcript_61284:627-1424(-)
MTRHQLQAASQVRQGRLVVQQASPQSSTLHASARQCLWAARLGRLGFPLQPGLLPLLCCQLRAEERHAGLSVRAHHVVLAGQGRDNGHCQWVAQWASFQAAPQHAELLHGRCSLLQGEASRCTQQEQPCCQLLEGPRRSPELRQRLAQGRPGFRGPAAGQHLGRQQQLGAASRHRQPQGPWRGRPPRWPWHGQHGGCHQQGHECPQALLHGPQGHREKPLLRQGQAQAPRPAREQPAKGMQLRQLHPVLLRYGWVPPHGLLQLSL